jgi:uncharacterized protein YcbK (DUF882 family)
LEGKVSRRELIKLILLGIQTAMIIPPDLAEARGTLGKHLSGKLFLHNEQTGESLRIQYLDKSGRINRQACCKLNHFFRCHYTNETAAINPKLFVLLDSVKSRLKPGDRPFLLYSGYRSKKYNRLLKGDDPDVAKNSYHIKGMAADISMDAVPNREIMRVAKSLKGGGVGSYAEFIHLDVGPVRSW